MYEHVLVFTCMNTYTFLIYCYCYIDVTHSYLSLQLDRAVACLWPTTLSSWGRLHRKDWGHWLLHVGKPHILRNCDGTTKQQCLSDFLADLGRCLFFVKQISFLCHLGYKSILIHFVSFSSRTQLRGSQPGPLLKQPWRKPCSWSLPLRRRFIGLVLHCLSQYLGGFHKWGYPHMDRL